MKRDQSADSDDSRQLEPPVGATAPPPSPASPLPFVRALTLSAVLSAGAFLAGAWLVFAPLLLEYGPEKPGAAWNQTAVGAVIAGVSLFRYFSPRHLPALDWVAVAAGGWLLVSPLVLDHLEHPASGFALYHDIVAGFLVIVLACGGILTRRKGRTAVATSSTASRR